MLRGVIIPKGKGQFWRKHVPDKPNNHINCELDWSMQRRVHYGQMLDCKRWTKGELHTAGEV